MSPIHKFEISRSFPLKQKIQIFKINLNFQYVSRAKKIDDEERNFKEKTSASMAEFQRRRKEREELKKRKEEERIGLKLFIIKIILFFILRPFGREYFFVLVYFLKPFHRTRMLEEKRKEYASQKTEILEKVHKPSEKFKNSESRTKQKSKSLLIYSIKWRVNKLFYILLN